MTTDKKPAELVEHRFKFTCTFGESERVETRIRSEAFVRGMLLDNFQSMSGVTSLKDRVYGVKVRGTKTQVKEFAQWWEEHAEDLCDTRTVLGIFIKEHL